MRVWILSRVGNFDSYENLRLREVASVRGIDVLMVAPPDFDLIVDNDGKKKILYRGEPVNLPDCIIPRRGAGSTYSTLALIRQFENLGVYALNSSRGIEAAKDKLATMQVLASNGVPVPKTMLAKFPFNIELVEKEFSYPIILKTVSGSRGKGVFLCENCQQLEDIIGLLETTKDSKVNVVVQEFISTSKGRDLRVMVLGGRVVGAMLRKAEEGKIKSNMHAGGSAENFVLNPEIERLALNCARLLELDFAGVDILFDKKGYKISEVNSSPGFEGFEQATGINMPSEVYDYVESVLKKRN